MEALGIINSRRYARSGVDVGSDVVNPAFCTDDEETDDEDSFFDLVIKSPDSVAIKGSEEASKKDFQFIESPRDVFLSKSDFSADSIPKPFSTVPVLRSPPKFKVFMLGLKKSSKCEKTESNAELKTSPLNQFSKLLKIEQSNRCTVKCRAEELPVATVFSRDNSLRSKMLKESSNDNYDVFSPEKTPKDSIPKYLKLIKPLYGKTSKRQHEKAAKITSFLTPSSSPVTAPLNLSPRKSADGSRVGSFKIVTRHLGKSRSASAAQPPLRRRDDSLLEQHDGIQGAILHCKKSYNSSSLEFSALFRSISNPSHQNSGRNSCEEQKRRSI